MNGFERDVRAAVYASFSVKSQVPTREILAKVTGSTRAAVILALRALADEHCLVLLPDGESIWMAHPFSGIETDFVVTLGERRWFANCVWDGLSILALFGDGSLDTHSPATGESLRFDVVSGAVRGEGLVHFLVPARRFWDNIGYT
jgi:hypothetical protein